MNTTTRLASSLLCCATLLTASMTVQARASCAPARPEAREAVFESEALFPRGGVDLSPSGRSRLAAYARALEQNAAVEVVVITLQPAPHVAGVDAGEAAHRRAAAVRKQLSELGVPPGRIYTEVSLRSRTVVEPLGATVAITDPVVIETVGAWEPRLGYQPSCVALA